MNQYKIKKLFYNFGFRPKIEKLFLEVKISECA